MSISLPAGRGEPADVRCPVRRRGAAEPISPRGRDCRARTCQGVSLSPPAPGAVSSVLDAGEQPSSSSSGEPHRGFGLVSVHPSSQPRTILRNTIVAVWARSEGIARRRLREKRGNHRPACVTRMAPIKPAARRTLHLPFSSFEFRCEEINVSCVLDSKPRIVAPPHCRAAAIYSTHPAGRSGGSWRKPARPLPVPAQPVIPAPSASAMSHQSRPHRMCDPLIRELNRFRGLAELSK